MCTADDYWLNVLEIDEQPTMFQFDTVELVIEVFQGDLSQVRANTYAIGLDLVKTLR
jgi:hypothetical protein